MNIQTFICNFACEVTTSYIHSHRMQSLLLNEIYLIPKPGVTDSNLMDGSKGDSAFHPSEVD